MKKKIFFLASLVTASAVLFTACRKDKTVDYATELQTHSDDQQRFSNEMDALANDDNTLIESSPSFNGRVDNVTTALTSLCDATVSYDSTSTTKKITIEFNGTQCAGATRTRKGVVVLTMPLATRWKDAGAVITDTIKNLKITRISDGKSITINGTRTITNVSGGRLRDLVLGTVASITHAVASSNMTVTFDDGSVRTWQVARKRVFTYGNGNFTITISGNGASTAAGNLSEWGTNRYGNSFETAITTPLVISGACQYRLTSGIVTHSKMVATTVVTFGLDANGNATTCPSGAYYMKIVWTAINGNVRTLIVPYY